jgi:hypothetical protein
MNSSSSLSASYTVNIYVDDRTWTYWRVTTRAPDKIPDAFTIDSINSAMRATQYIIPVTMTGFDTTSVRGKTNADISLDGESFSSSKNVDSGETFYIAVDSSKNINTTVSATITVDYRGTNQDISFNVTTKPNTGDVYSLTPADLGSDGTYSNIKNLYSRAVYIGSTNVTRASAEAQCA